MVKQELGSAAKRKDKIFKKGSKNHRKPLGFRRTKPQQEYRGKKKLGRQEKLSASLMWVDTMKKIKSSSNTPGGKKVKRWGTCPHLEKKKRPRKAISGVKSIKRDNER